MSEIRIGLGVTGAPRVPPPLTPRRGPGRLIVAAAVVVLLAGAVAGTKYVVDAKPDAARIPTSESTVFVVPTADIGEEAACVLLFPSYSDAVAQVQALADRPDWLTIKWGTLRMTIANLEGARAYVPPDMRPEVDAVLATLRQMDAIAKGEASDGPLRLEAFRDAGRRFGARCLKYGR